MSQRNGRCQEGEAIPVRVKEEEIPIEISTGFSMTPGKVKFEEEEEEEGEEEEGFRGRIKEEEVPIEIGSGAVTPHSGGCVKTEDGVSLDFQDGKRIKVEVKEEAEEIKVRGDNLCKEEEHSMEIGTDGQYTRSVTLDTLGASGNGHVFPKPLSREEKGDIMARDVTQSDLIAAVQQKPELWDPEYPRYSDRVQKKKAWAEVYKSLIPNWGHLSTKQKENRGKDLSTRWRSLRDRYRRELTEERLSVQSGAPIRTKKRHPYARELAFLRRAMETRETTSNMAAEEEESEAGPSNPRTVAESEETSHSAPCRLQISEAVQETRQGATLGFRRSRRRQQRTSSCSNDQLLRLLLEMSERQSSIVTDKDIFRNISHPRVVFCRSLLPLLEGLSDERELQAKEDIYMYLLAAINAQRRNLPPPRMHLSTMPTSTCPGSEPCPSEALPKSHPYPSSLPHSPSLSSAPVLPHPPVTHCPMDFCQPCDSSSTSHHSHHENL